MNEIEHESGLSQEERTWGMLAHMSAFAGFLIPQIGAVLGPLVVWVVKKDEMAFVDDQGKESLNFQITMLIAAIVAWVLKIILIGYLLVLAVYAFNIVMVIMATIRANEGEFFRYPVSLHLIR